MTTIGGEHGSGTVFQVDASGDLTTLHSFNITDGKYPQAGLLLAVDGKFYGTTLVGGNSGGAGGCSINGGCGTIFRIDSLGAFTSLHSFNIFDGRWPESELIQASDGGLYGTAIAGGPFGGQGVVFRLSASTIAANEVSPTSGPAEGGTALDLLGGGFLSGATVTVGGASGTDVTVTDPTFLYLVTPPLSPGTLNDVSVSVPDPGFGPRRRHIPTPTSPTSSTFRRSIRSTTTSRRSSATASPLDAAEAATARKTPSRARRWRSFS